MTEVVLPPPPAVAPPAVAPPAAAPPAPAAAARRPSLNLDPATRRQTIIVAGLIAALFFGSQILNEALPSRQARPGNPIAIGQRAQITPFEGWVTSEPQSGVVRLAKGVVVLDLSAQTVGQNAGDLATAYLEQVLRPGATQLTATDIETVRTANGSAARFSYQGIFGDNTIEGEVTTFFAGGQGVIADAWSPQGRLQQALSEVHAMLETIQVRS